MATNRMPTTVALVGVAGFGARHLETVRILQERGEVVLTALIDPIVKAQSSQIPPPSDAPLFNTLGDAITSVGPPDIVIICVPIHLHTLIAKEALLAGCDVLLEKPPFARMSDFTELLELEKQTERVVQIAFQSLGSAALEAFAADEFGLGKIRAVRAMGIWLRCKWYWDRAPWVGRRNDGDIAITDGVATNGLAHAIVTALNIAGIRYIEDVQNVEVEMYRANPIDVDDTTSIRITPVSGPVITANLTLCGTVQLPAIVEVVGETGIASFRFETDNVDIASRTIHYGRTNLLENLLAHRNHGTPLLVPLRATGAFMRVLEAIRTGHQPVHVERKWVEKHGEGQDMHPVIDDIEGWIRKAADIDGLLSEAGAPWAFTGRDSVIAQASLDGKPILQVLDGLGTTPFSSPRPYIHPIQTLGGVEVTATRPADHDWHTGLGMTIPDVDGTTFWGGPTYVRGKGYIPLNNYGTKVTEDLQYLKDAGSSDAAPLGLRHTMAWRNPSNHILVREVQTLLWKTLDTRPIAPGFELSFSSSLTAVNGPISLGSPGTNGRENAGYGGFFWRLPRCADVEIHSATQEGEDQVHGSISPWISWSARFKGGPGSTGDATLVVVPQDESRSDPWFVRCTGYPGIGSAIAWAQRVEIPVGETITRSFRCAVLDGRWSRSIVQEIAEGLHVSA